MEISPKDKKNIVIVLLITLGLLSLFLLTKSIGEINAYDKKEAGQQQNLISITGEGEVFAVPDIATVSFGAVAEAKTMSGAQKALNEQIDKAMRFLKDSGIADKDIKTQNYNSYPKYEQKYSGAPVACSQYYCPTGNSKSVIIGYEATQSVSVKIRNTDDTGKIIDGLGKTGLSNISGPDFSIDDEDALKMEARKKAIDDAKKKARALARDLGVRLGDITSFNENTDGQMYYASNMLMDAKSSAPVSPEANLPKGENKITSSVTISWEIK